MHEDAHRECLSPETAREYLRDVEPMWRAFWFHMHLVAKNLSEFADGLARVSDDVFAYHVSGQKNDLARWVQEVIGDSVLARDLSGIATKDDAARIVRERVDALEQAALPGTRGAV